MFCTKCGKELKEGINCCPYCGEIVKKANFPKAVTSNALKLKVMKILLILSVFCLISGLYYALTENKSKTSVLMGEWYWIGAKIGDYDYSSTSPEAQKKYYVKFLKNGTFEQHLDDKETRKGKWKWAEDKEMQKKAKDNGMIGSGRVEIGGQQGLMFIAPGDIYGHGGSYSLTLMFDDMVLTFQK